MSTSLAALQQAYADALRGGDEAAARAAVARARDGGVAERDIYLEIFAPSMVAIGQLWERNELSVAEEHLATAITDRLIGELSPAFGQAGAAPLGTALIGCVEGERHALGPRMLADMFRQRGWRVLYLGADVPTSDWIDLAVRYAPDLVAISVGMRARLPAVRALIASLREALPGTLVLVGGAALAGDPELWRALDADLYHPNTVAAVDLASARMNDEPRPTNDGRRTTNDE